MSGHRLPSCADQGWAEAMFGDLQRQLDDLSGQLQSLTEFVHNRTLASPRNDHPGDSSPAPHMDGSDG